LHLVSCSLGTSCSGTVHRHPGAVQTSRDTESIQCRCQQSIRPNSGNPSHFSRDHSHKTQMQVLGALKLTSVYYGDKKRRCFPARTSPMPLIDFLHYQDLLNGSGLSAPYLAGIWLANAHRELCWRASVPAPAVTSYIAPSFSWTSISAPI